MANSDQLAVLAQGAEAWNEWRKQHELEKPDLAEEDLSKWNLSDCNLKFANLRGADLRETKFWFTQLVGADLSYSDLRNAVVVYSDFQDANLSNSCAENIVLLDCNLTGVDFRYCDLFDAIFTRSIIDGARFEGSSFGHSIFADVDLSTAFGLEQCDHHWHPSTIGIDTIVKSGGKIPHLFLRETGIPDRIIDYIGSLVENPIQYYSCFISYSSMNQEFAKRLYADLQNNNVRCWLATEDMKIGDRFRARIEESIRLHDKLLLILSETSVNSPWVESEVESAMERERKEGKTILFPVKLDNAVMDTSVAWAAEIRRTRHIGDFLDWKNHGSYTKALDRLLRDLKAESNK